MLRPKEVSHKAEILRRASKILMLNYTFPQCLEGPNTRSFDPISLIFWPALDPLLPSGFTLLCPVMPSCSKGSRARQMHSSNQIKRSGNEVLLSSEEILYILKTQSPSLLYKVNQKASIHTLVKDRTHFTRIHRIFVVAYKAIHFQ